MSTPPVTTSLAPHPGAELIVAETFVSFQGEGPSTGQQAVFIRLSRCNLACAWCDTPYTWDWNRFDPRREAFRVAVADLATWTRTRMPRLIVITGGEPLLQRDAVLELVGSLTAQGKDVEIETNGTIPPAVELIPKVTRFNVSPKLSRSQMPRSRTINDAALRAFAACGRAIFKFVVCERGELEEIAELEKTYGLKPVWLMPQATSPEQLSVGLRDLASEALARGWNLSGRLHVAIWGDRRGH